MGAQCPGSTSYCRGSSVPLTSPGWVVDGGSPFLSCPLLRHMAAWTVPGTEDWDTGTQAVSHHWQGRGLPVSIYGHKDGTEASHPPPVLHRLYGHCTVWPAF